MTATRAATRALPILDAHGAVDHAAGGAVREVAVDKQGLAIIGGVLEAV